MGYHHKPRRDDERVKLSGRHPQMYKFRTKVHAQIPLLWYESLVILFAFHSC